MFQRTTKYLVWSIVFSILSSFTLMLIPLRDVFGKEHEKAISVMIAIAFWATLGLEQYFFWVCNAGRKMIQRRTFKGRRIVKETIGIITFASSVEAKACDCVLAISAAVTILLSALRIKTNWLAMLVLTVLVLSFNLHCILNGTTYRYIKAFYKIKKEREKRGNKKNTH